MKILTSLLFYLAALLPYSTLWYKKVSILKRLLFASLFQIVIFYILFFILSVTDNSAIIWDAYFYEMLFFILLIFNFILILFTWIIKGWQKK